MSDNRITPSKKEIYVKLMDIAEKYTDIKDPDFLKTGLFGYINETMAMMMRDSTFHKSMLYNESFLNTAVIPRSIYNWAKMFNIKVQNAIPSYADIEILLPTDRMTFSSEVTAADKLRYGDELETIVNGRDFFIINKEDPILAGEYYFMLENSIVLLVSDDSSTMYTAQTIPSEYVSTDYEGRPSVGAKYFQVIVTGDGIIIKARAYQYSIEKKDIRIINSSFLNRIQRVQFTDQFCEARLFVLGTGGKREEIKLKYSEVIGAEVDDPTIRCAFYNLTSENELELIFREGEGMFIPTPATKMQLYIYTTKGENVPRKYTGDDAVILFSDARQKRVPAIVRFNPTNIIGGKNAPTLDKIKSRIINEISTRNTITTEADLNSYFEKIAMLIEDINDGKLRFIKQRDDILRRVFNAYILLRDDCHDDGSIANSSYLSPCVPTTTLDVKLTSFENNENFMTVQYQGHYINEENQLMTPYTSQTSENITDGYICPFLIRLSSSPFLYAQYIFTLLDQELGIKLNSNSNKTSGSLAITPISVHVFRGMTGSSADNNITFTLLTNTVEDFTGKTLSIDMTVNDRVITISEVTTTSKAMENTNNSVFETSLEFSVNVSDSLDSAYTLNVGNISLDRGDNSCEFSISDGTSVVSFVTDGKITFYQNMDTIMHSNIEVTNDGTTNIYTIKEVPLVHLSFFNQTSSDISFENRWDGFVSQLFAYIKCLKENLERLETSTFYSLKFFNTYGASMRYSTPTTNINLMLNITLLDGYKDNETLKSEIRSYIRRIVDRTNESGDGIKVSTIIAMLSQVDTYGTYINKIEFLGLNDTFSQYIKPLEIEENIGYPPEWLNLEWDTIEEMITFE